MFIFEKRPLSLILCIMLGVFFVFSFFGESIGQAIYILALLLPFVPFSIKRLAKYRVLGFVISASMILSLVASYFYFERYFKTYERFEGTVSVEGEILSIEQTTSYSASAVVKTDNISNERASRYKIRIKLSLEEAEDLTVGDKISFNTTLEEFSSDGSFNAKNYYFADGISANGREVTDLKVTEESDGSLSTRLIRIREVLRRKAVLMSDADAGNLLGALLTGERSELSPELRLDFMRIGISHVLALSGMHLAILTLAIDRLLRLFSVPRKFRTVSTIIFCSLYMGFVGFSVSVVRAGIMLILGSLLYLLQESKDSLTSLSFAVFLIILITPYAIYDIALWLSAFATFGVIIGASKDEDDKERGLALRLLSGLWDAIFLSVLANGATLLISVSTFGGFSLLSPFSTIIFSFLIEIYMYLGSLMLLLGLVYLPLSYPLGKLLIYLCDLIEKLAALSSSPDISYLPSNYDLLMTMISVFTAVFFALMILKLNKRAISIIILTCFIGIFVTAGIFKYNEYSTEELVYTSQDKSDVFLIKSGKDSALVSSSQYSESLAYDSLELLSKYKITILDKYIITHYAYSLEEDLLTLLSSVLIKEISIPHPKNDDEILIYKKLVRLLEDYRTELTLHNSGGEISLGSFKYYPLYSNAYGEGSSQNAFLITYKETNKYLYLSSGMIDKKYEEVYSKIINDADTVIFGSHGKKYKESVYISERYTAAFSIILSSEHLFFTQSAYAKYNESGCKIISHPQNVQLIKAKIRR